MSTKTVLRVEDNEDNREIYALYLGHAGYRVLQAANGSDGIATARADRPDLILMDLSMPVMDGWTATRKLKEDPQTSAIPILALSAHVLMSGEHEAMMELGFEAYLTKPVEPTAVLSAVRSRIGGP